MHHRYVGSGGNKLSSDACCGGVHVQPQLGERCTCSEATTCLCTSSLLLVLECCLLCCEALTEHAADASARDVHVHGFASEHALTAGDWGLHCSGGCQRSHARNNAGSGAIDTFLAMCDCARQPVACSVRLARVTNHPIPQLRMQIPFSDVHASAISILAQINLPGVSVPDVWQKS